MQNLRGLYVITDPTLCANALQQKVEQAILGGAQVIQYRNKTASSIVQLGEATMLQSLCVKYNRLFLINDNVELAIETNADGVHLGQSDGDIQTARKKLGTEKIIGVTCHSDIQAALKAQEQSANYVAFGRFFPSQSKPNAAAAEINIIPKAKAQLTIPIVAIGGISVENASSLTAAGADMLAVIHSVFGQDNVKNATEELVKLL